MKEALRTLKTARALRSATPDRLVNDEAVSCRKQFAPVYGSIPVLICAKDEAGDLPATLVSLARAEARVVPIVVANGSSDKTAEIAADLGAAVVELPDAGKAAAFAAGLNYATSELDARRILATDADTVVGKYWPEAMIKQVGRIDEHRGGIAIGGVLIHHGPSKSTDALRSIALAAKQAANVKRGSRPGARGSNLGLQLTDDIAETIAKIPGEEFIAHDRALVTAVLSAGGEAIVDFADKTVVATKGDRYRSVGEYLSAALRLTPIEHIYHRDEPGGGSAQQ